MDPRTMLVGDHIDGLRQTAAEIRAERQRAAGAPRRHQVPGRLRTALGRWLVDIGEALVGRPAAGHGHVARR